MDVQEEDKCAKQNGKVKTEDFRLPEDSRCCPRRWLLAVMGLWLGIMNYMLNSNMSIAVVCMVKDEFVDYADNVNNTASILDTAINNSVSQRNVLFSQASSNETYSYKTEGSKNSCEYYVKAKISKSRGAEFSWNKKTQSFVLSSYFYGYMIMQIPAGWFAAQFGGKRVIQTNMAVASLLTLLIPTFARANVYILIVARALLGICVGTVLPSYFGLVGTWALPTERSRFMALCWFGHMAGAVLGYSSAGFLCVHGFANGWDSIFYVHGLVGGLFVLAWWYIVYSSPQHHPHISEAEKSLLLKHGHIQTTQPKQNNSVPWTHILTHIPVYVVFMAHICDNWTFYLLLTCLPQFMKDVLKFDVQSNGIYSCLPFLTLMCGIGFSGMFADFVQSKKCISVTTTRKLFQITGLTGVAIFILIPGYLSCDYRAVAIVFLCLSTLFEGIGQTAGYSTNVIDIAPRYASVIFAISNTLASIPGMVAPVVVAALTKNETSEEWRVVFYITGGFSLLTALVYGIFANSELANWAKSNTDIEIICDSLQSKVCSEKLMEHEIDL